MVRSLQVRSLHTEVRSLHSKVSSLHQISYFAPYISYFAPWRKLTWKVDKRQKDKGKEKKEYCNATKDSPFLTGVEPSLTHGWIWQLLKMPLSAHAHTLNNARLYQLMLAWVGFQRTSFHVRLNIRSLKFIGKLWNLIELNASPSESLFSFFSGSSMPGRFRVLLTITLVHPCNLVDLKFLLDPEDPADSEHVKTQWDLRDLEICYDLEDTAQLAD